MYFVRSMKYDRFLQAGALCKATNLRKLRITTYNGIKNFNFPNILQYNHGLKHLLIDVSTVYVWINII